MARFVSAAPNCGALPSTRGRGVPHVMLATLVGVLPFAIDVTLLAQERCVLELKRHCSLLRASRPGSGRSAEVAAEELARAFEGEPRARDVVVGAVRAVEPVVGRIQVKMPFGTAARIFATSDAGMKRRALRGGT
jgi:hypothetical protein